MTTEPPATNRMKHTLHELHRGKTSRKYQKAQELLVQRRRNAIEARRKHESAIHCHGKDIFSAADIKHAQETFNRFLEVQEELAEAASKADRARGRELRAITGRTDLASSL